MSFNHLLLHSSLSKSLHLSIFPSIHPTNPSCKFRGNETKDTHPVQQSIQYQSTNREHVHLGQRGREELEWDVELSPAASSSAALPVAAAGADAASHRAQQPAEQATVKCSLVGVGGLDTTHTLSSLLRILYLVVDNDDVGRWKSLSFFLSLLSPATS